jgi:predicted nucleotidyltransferase
MREFFNLQRSNHALLTHFVNGDLKIGNRLEDHLTRTIARQLSEAYGAMWMQDEFEGEPFSVTLPPMNIDLHHGVVREHLENIVSIVQGDLSEHVDTFVLHGSHATQDAISGWSDVDTLMVISEEAVRDPDRLMHIRASCRQLGEVFRRIDPLQHHGVMVTTAIDVERAYAEEVLPLLVLERSGLVTGSPVLRGKRFSSSGDAHGLRKRLQFIIDAADCGEFAHHAYRDAYLLSEYRNAENAMYQLKYYLGQFLMLPTWYLSAIGKPSHKKESFQRIRGVFPEHVMEWIDCVSTLRTAWGEHEGGQYHPNVVPDWVRDVIFPDYLVRGAEVACAILQQLDHEST